MQLGPLFRDGLRKSTRPGAVSGWLVAIVSLLLDSRDARTLIGDWRYVAVAALVIGGLFALGLYGDLANRIAALEDERTVKLIVEGGKLDGFSMPQEGSVLNIDSDGLDHVEHCTVHLLEVLWEVGGIYRDGVLQEPDWKSMFKNEDIYLHWHNKDAAVPGLTFKGTAVALVAWRDVQSGRHYRLGSVGGKTYHLPSGTSVLAVEVGAKNTAYQSCAFKIYVPFGDNEEMQIEKMAWDEKPSASF